MTRPLNRHPRAIRSLHIEFVGFDHRLATFGFGKRMPQRQTHAIQPPPFALFCIHPYLSTYLLFSGDTKALASACGPIEVRTAAELPSKATLEINVRPLSGIAGERIKPHVLPLTNNFRRDA